MQITSTSTERVKRQDVILTPSRYCVPKILGRSTLSNNFRLLHNLRDSTSNEMSNLLVQYPILAKLWRDANEEDAPETKSIEFWVAYLTRAFNDLQKYHVAQEISPDSTRRRIDIVVKQFDESHSTLFAIKFVEGKKSGGDIKKGESQALDGAQRYIVADDLEFMNVMTTDGTNFRLWRVLRPGQYQNGWNLEPRFGSQKLGDRRAYISLDDNMAWHLEVMIAEMKERVPLRAAPIVPSQQGQATYQQGQGKGKVQALPDGWYKFSDVDGYQQFRDDENINWEAAPPKNVVISHRDQERKFVKWILWDGQHWRFSADGKAWQAK